LLNLKMMIDKFLHNRTTLEIQRAAMAKNWILAVELRRRLALWYGPGSPQEQEAEVRNLVLPAALQHVQASYDGLTEVTGIALKGFRGNMVKDFFQAQFPHIPFTESAETEDNAGGRPLVLHRDTPQVTAARYPGYEFFLDRLVNNYRVSTMGVNLAEL
jgi:hypothetical protein